jgi:transcription elongation factor Elf1
MEQKVPTTFDCPFCNHEKAVDCKIDKDTSIGSIRCRVCNESYQMITTCTRSFFRCDHRTQWALVPGGLITI